MLRRVFVFQPEAKAARSREPGSWSTVHGHRPTTKAASRCKVCACRSERAVKITVEGKDESGDDVRFELDGLGARVVQHELDHLDGVLIIDRTDDEHRKEALATLRPRAVLR